MQIKSTSLRAISNNLSIASSGIPVPAANIKLLVHMNTDFSDSSLDNRTPTVSNAVVGGVGKFGASGGTFATADYTAYVTYPNDTAWDFGSGDFTVECWHRRQGANMGYTGLISHDQIGGTRGWLMYKNDTSVPAQSQSIGFAAYSGAVGYSVLEPAQVSTGVFRHYAAVRDGNTLRLYREGVQVSSVDVTGVTFNAPSEPLAVGVLWGTGSPNASSSCDNYLDDVRIIKGLCIYPGGTTFTPPSTEFPNP